MKNQLYYGNNLEILRNFVPSESVDLCYMNPYYASLEKKTWVWDQEAEENFLEIVSSPQNNCPKEVVQWIISFEKILKKTPSFAFLLKNALLYTEIFRVLKKTGSCYIHCKTDFAPYLRLLADAVFSTQKGIFRNEIVLCYSKPQDKKLKKYKPAAWKKKYYQPLHETLLFYTKSKDYFFQAPFHQNTSYWTLSESPAESALAGIGYRPSVLLNKIIRASSMPDQVVLDLFAKAGSTAIEAHHLQRNWILIEENETLCDLIKFRLVERFIDYQTD